MANDDNKAVATLVCGILSWFTCPVILAVVAIVLGSGSNNGLARAGVILAWLNILVSVLGFILVLVTGVGAAIFGFG